MWMRGSDFGQAFRVSLRIYGLLEPTDVELSQFFGHGEGGCEVEAAVAVDQQGDVGADGVPRGGHAVEARASEICKVSSGSARIHLVEWRALDGAKAVADGAFGGGREVTGASGGWSTGAGWCWRRARRRRRAGRPAPG